ncbi:MAG: hypothetical protein GY906_04885 [bacterium]|nr:hypothetical protein [bacterium]
MSYEQKTLARKIASDVFGAGTERYQHSRSVAIRVGAAGLGERSVAVAWLHDVVEDTDTTLADLVAEGVDPAIVAAVSSLTRTEGQAYRDYIGDIKYNGDREQLGRHVKIQDLIENISRTEKPSMIRRYAQALEILSFDY